MNGSGLETTVSPEAMLHLLLREATGKHGSHTQNQEHRLPGHPLLPHPSVWMYNFSFFLAGSH
jgi:hypothetical protein